ncbi:hypothetical protein R6Q57_024900 [Mikania cordata]
MNKSFPQLGLKEKDCIEMSWIESVLYFAGLKGTPKMLLGNKTDPHVSYFKAKSDFVTKPITQQVFLQIREKFYQQKLVFMIMDPYGGRMNKISKSHIPFPHRRGNLYNIQYLVKWEVNRLQASNEHMHWLRELSGSWNLMYQNIREKRTLTIEIWTSEQTSRRTRVTWRPRCGVRNTSRETL